MIYCAREMIEKIISGIQQTNSPLSMNSQRTSRSTSRHPVWRSLEQLSLLWGLSPARTNLVARTLIRSGRLEVRQPAELAGSEPEFRIAKN